MTGRVGDIQISTTGFSRLAVLASNIYTTWCESVCNECDGRSVGFFGSMSYSSGYACQSRSVGYSAPTHWTDMHEAGHEDAAQQRLLSTMYTGCLSEAHLQWITIVSDIRQKIVRFGSPPPPPPPLLPNQLRHLGTIPEFAHTTTFLGQ